MLSKLVDRVVYTCKGCGWQGSILHIWEDIKPKRCPNKKCATNFNAFPDKLDIKKPEEKAQPLEEPKKKNKKNG
jgi:hypothetical protein